MTIKLPVEINSEKNLKVKIRKGEHYDGADMLELAKEMM
jgi:hypothetical protein